MKESRRRTGSTAHEFTTTAGKRSDDRDQADTPLYVSDLIMAFIGFYPPALSDFEWPSRESRACKCASAGCVKGLFFDKRLKTFTKALSVIFFTLVDLSYADPFLQRSPPFLRL